MIINEPPFDDAHVRRWQLASRLAVGATYSWFESGEHPWVLRTVDHVGDCWAGSYLRNDDGALEAFVCGAPPEDMPYEQAPALVVVLAPMLVGELRPNDNGDKPTAVFVDGELVAVFAAGHQDRASAYAEHLKGGA